MAMLHRIPVSIAGILINVHSPLDAAELGIEARLGPFITAGEQDNQIARVDLQWRESDRPPSAPGELIYDPGSIWRMYRDGTDYCAELTYHGDGDGAQTHGVLRSNPAWDQVTLTEQRTGGDWHSVFNIGAGELMLRTAILFTGGLVLHASGVDDQGRGIVFIGHSGAGKSTQVGLWMKEPSVIAMNDDRIAVRTDASGSACYGTPWGGTAGVARNHGAPLTALIALEQAAEDSIERVAPDHAARTLASRTFLPYWDARLMARALANLDSLLAAVPVYRLRCRPHREVVSLVRSVL